MSLNILNPIAHKSPAAGEREKRCNCGQLLAILLENGIELKCKRCKRLHTIHLEDLLKDRESMNSEPIRQAEQNLCHCYQQGETK